MRRLLTAYRVMANVIGVLLIVLVLIGLPLNELHRVNEDWIPLGSSAQDFGSWIATYLGVAHGYLYLVFLITAFVLSRRASWTMPFTLVTLVSGTVPVLSFWAERRATHHTRAEHPELVSG